MSPSTEKTSLSCVIAFRNEEAHLTKLIEGLKKQQNVSFEVVLIDDHSTDNSFALANKLTADLPTFTVLKNKGWGKKAALANGVAASRFDYLVFTDADCIHPQNWLANMAHYFNSSSALLLVGPVRLTKPTNFFEYFQAFDFLSLVTSAAGAIGASRPIMCNGANLAVYKDLWLAAQSSLKEEWASGDDIFLLQYCKAHKKNIAFVNSHHAIVQTYPEPKLSAFLQQRARWASKSKGYTDNFTLLVAWTVLLVNLFILALPLLFLLYIPLSFGLLALYIIKITLDYHLIKRGAYFFKMKLNTGSYLGIAFIYPLYIIASVLWAFFGNNTWKNRKINQIIYLL
ncbi:glycosyltransferase [Saccharicrinis carchari]|uniref:glycosyltransferase n=1 Tax=Saccharicrinis carchari TaxID=1168039 RepID=UPI00163D9B4A|nr:glycosyltransferase [Saccharicrinis carchari]